MASAAQLDDLINVTRVQHDVAPLAMDDALDEVARLHSEDMKVQNFLSHESPTNGDLKKRLEAYETDYYEANENLATAYFDAVEAMHGWLNSPEHRKIILNDKYSLVGSGVFLNYYTQIFIEPTDKNNVDSEIEEIEEPQDISDADSDQNIQ